MKKTIYFPKDVAERMRGFPQFNWSAIAQLAFVEAMDDPLKMAMALREYERRRLKEILQRL